MQITKSTFDGSGRIHLGSAYLNDKKDSDKKVYGRGQVVNVFFDGTGNNYFNANKRPGEESSYGNDKSNIARMWESIDGDKGQSLSVYVEGIGTKRGQSDSGFMGGGFGLGEYGVEKRVYGAFDDIKKKINELGVKLPNVLTLNVFGFSRGAAAARANPSTRPSRTRVPGVHGCTSRRCTRGSGRGRASPSCRCCSASRSCAPRELLLAAARVAVLQHRDLRARDRQLDAAVVLFADEVELARGLVAAEALPAEHVDDLVAAALPDLRAVRGDVQRRGRDLHQRVKRHRPGCTRKGTCRRGDVQR